MIRARRVGRWILITTLLVGVCTSCNETGPSGDYTSIEGVYTCQESSPHAGLRQYLVEIDKVNDSENLYIIVNFHNIGDTEFLYAELDMETLRITSQIISNIKVDGSGVVSDEFRSIQLNYLTDDGAAILEFYSNYSR